MRTFCANYLLVCFTYFSTVAVKISEHEIAAVSYSHCHKLYTMTTQLHTIYKQPVARKQNTNKDTINRPYSTMTSRGWREVKGVL